MDRENAGAPDEQQRETGVCLEVDDVVQAAAIEIGKYFRHAGEARKCAVHGIDQGGDPHQRKGGAQRVVVAAKDRVTAIPAAATRPRLVKRWTLQANTRAITAAARARVQRRSPGAGRG